MRIVPLFLVLAHAGLVMLMFRAPMIAPPAVAAVTPDPVIVVPTVPVTESLQSIADIELLSTQEDSLMSVMQDQPGDTWPMEVLARLYLSHGWYEAAIGPLSRAASLEPGRPDLWVDLGRAWQGAGRLGSPTDDDLRTAAEEFLATVERWGHGC